MTAFFCGAVKTAVEALHWPDAPDILWGTVGALRDRVLAGDRASVIVASDAALEVLAARGLVARERIVRLGRAGTGVAVSVGFSARQPPHPNPPPQGGRESDSPSPCGRGWGEGAERNASTADSLKRTLLQARSIAWADASSGATAGKHFESVIEALGIAEAVRAKATLYQFGVEAVAACGRGEVELAISQVTEIVNRPGVALLGELPPPFALATGYAAAPLDDSGEAHNILAKLASPETRAALAAIGFKQERPA